MDGEDEGYGPACNDIGDNKVMMGCNTSNIYHDDDDATTTTARAVVFVRALHHRQPFDISYSSSTTTFFKSPEGMATTLGYPAFTSAQWKELERQAMIYKYMVASVPVPPDLLLPFTQNHLSSSLPPDSSANSHLGGCSIFNLKFGNNNNKDPEPGRCKRTDGKKWRCSRDVAPHQKYCERHMHRGRPRSRKHVEVPPTVTNPKKTRLHLPPPAAQPTADHSLRSDTPSTVMLKNTKNNEVLSSPDFKEQPNRGLDWMMESKVITMDTTEQQWQNLMTEESLYSTTATNVPSIFNQDYGEEQLNLFSLPEIGDSQNDDYNLFLNPYNPPRDFIDAWSNDNSNNPISENNNDSTGVANGNLSPSSLNLSMAMAVGNSLDEEMGPVQIGEVGDCNHQHHKSHALSWLNPVPWMSSAPGGPLAEVLRPNNVTGNSHPGSPYAGKDVDNVSPPGTSASSPSGVLQRTMLSLSDSSVCNSPTLAATSAAAPEIVGFQWLS